MKIGFWDQALQDHMEILLEERRLFRVLTDMMSETKQSLFLESETDRQIIEQCLKEIRELKESVEWRNGYLTEFAVECKAIIQDIDDRLSDRFSGITL